MSNEVDEIITSYRAEVTRLHSVINRLEAGLLRVRSIGATSGTRLDAWNEAFDVINEALESK